MKPLLIGMFCTSLSGVVAAEPLQLALDIKGTSLAELMTDRKSVV